jgi:hypothetical protein
MILVFKTTVKTKTDVERIDKALNSYLGTRKWNFDLEDCDKILRIESESAKPSVLRSNITALMKNSGFECAELTV